MHTVFAGVTWPVVALIATLAATAVALFLVGLALALRGSSPRDRPENLRAYAACLRALRKNDWHRSDVDEREHVRDHSRIVESDLEN